MFSALQISRAQETAAPHDSTISQKWTSDFGYSFTLPQKARYNKLGSEVKKEQHTERQNFILPGGSGAITIYHYQEGRMVPKDYKLLDSIHYYDVDSAGRNGMIHRRVYILKDIAVQMDVLLTDKGQTEYGAELKQIFDSFVPPPGAERRLEAWRYGRNPKEYENGRY
jgi:hypothetical protein